MKPIICYLTVCISVAILQSCHYSSKTNEQDSTALKTSVANLKMYNDKIDFGTVSNDTTLFAKFIFANTGTDTLKIINIQPDCSCTSANLSKRNILPNDTASISLTISTHNKGGHVALYSTITTNTETKFYALRVLANVK